MPDAAYAAFLSYSRKADAELGAALQDGLHRFAKPWYRLRAIRVFRDDGSLAANPGPWSSIAAALEHSEHLVLLASPAAAESHWVAREAEHWLAHRPSDNLILALTDGEVVWDAGRGEFDSSKTTALPSVLEGAFAEEPRWVDLRWARSDERLSLREPRFRESIADLAAPLRGRDKDELLGDDVRLHRQARRLAGAAITALAILAAGAIVAAVQAVQQRDTARAQQRLATSCYLAAQSSGALDSRLDLAALLGVEGYGREQTLEARSSLLAVLWRTARLERILYASPRDLLSLATGPDGMVAAGGRHGTVRIWPAPAAKVLARPSVSARLWSPGFRWMPRGIDSWSPTEAGA